MYRVIIKRFPLALLLLGPLGWAACSAADGKTKDPGATAPALVAVSPAAAIEQPIARFIRVTGSLTAEEQAEVAAETAGRVDGHARRTRHARRVGNGTHSGLASRNRSES